MRSTSACGGSHFVAQPVSEGLHSFLGAGAQRGVNAALAGTGHGFSEMHALSIFGVKVWALNIEKKSAVRLCKTWQDKFLCVIKPCNCLPITQNHFLGNEFNLCSDLRYTKTLSGELIL